MKIYNSLTRKKESFEPIKKGRVGMYVCGPTVYDEPHIGHARSAYIFDVIRSYLKHKGYKVKFVRNVTDVDDKIINKAKEEFKGESLNSAVKKIATKYLSAYHQALDQLGISARGPGIIEIEPKASEYIDKMKEFIKILIEKKVAYQSGGDVYFDITQAKNYGKLSNQSIDAMRIGVRVSPTENKRNPLDFALWKSAKEDEPSWDSDWGKGRPGWHIECSVMSMDVLGNEFDIHGGGLDLIFPHHENEIAQAEGAGKKFARFWIHHGLLTINGQKMAKSLGNFITIKDVLNRYPVADILKIFYLQAHYSSPIDFSWQKLEEIKKGYETIDILRNKLIENYRRADITKVTKSGTGPMRQFRDRFIERMDDNFDTPGALAVLFEMVKRCNKTLESDEPFKKSILNYALTVMKDMTEVFGLTFLKEKHSAISDDEIEEKIKLRLELKKQKEYKEADKIRQNLAADGIILEDSEEDTLWRRKI
ncbi:MAG: cysteine--tRNA ligase [Omnitrophica bacterium]|nr:cysteine--tRNA ligase [Candidatus Omnitrophota bacterium]